MIGKLFGILLGWLLVTQLQPVQAQTNFPHPCVGFNLADFQRMRTNLSVDPWRSGFAVFASQSTSSSNYVMQGPFTSVTRNNTGFNTNQAAFDSDMAAAYNLALMWNATSNTAYAAKATTILTSWFTTLTNWDTFDGVVGLEVSVAGYQGAPAAEILRYTYPGWTSSNTFVCSKFFTNMVWNWIQTAGYGTGNQGAAKVQAMASVSVFCDNTNWFSITTNIFMTDTCNSLDRNSLSTGQNAESGRDQGHPLGAIGSHLTIADLCWKATAGGVDFYSYLTNRILLEMEYYARYNMGDDNVPYQTFGPCNNSWSTISTSGRGGQYARAQLVHVKAAYNNRLALPTPYSTAYLNWFTVDDNDFLYDNSAVPAMPAAPEGLAVSVGQNEISINWRESVGAKTYNVLRSQTNGGPYALIATNLTGTAYVSAGLTNGTNYLFVVTATGNGGTSTNSSAISCTPQALTLVAADVGTVGTAGSTTNSSGVWTVKGAGGDIGGGADSGQFAFQNLLGDGEVIARLTKATWVSSAGKIGLMMRVGTNTDAAEASLVFDRGQSSTPRVFYRRTTADGNTYSFSGAANQSLPLWLRLRRAGNSFTAYTSVDGTNWVNLGSAIVAMPETIYAGLFVCSRSSSLATALFDNVTMSKLTPPAAPTGLIATGGDKQINLIWPDVSGASGYNVKRAPTSGGTFTNLVTALNATSYLDTNVVNGTTYYYVVSALNSAGESTNTPQASAKAGMPDPWLDADIGTVSTEGSGTFNNGATSFTIQGSGGDVGGTSDNFNFVYTSLTNNGTITARLNSATWIASAGKIGVMMRETTNSGSIQAWIFLDRGSSSALRMGYRSSTNGSTSFAGSGPSNITPPEWLRLQRVGNTFTTYYSADGQTWTPLGTNTFSSFASPCLVGLAVCSRNAALATAVFDNVSVPGFAPPAAPASLNAAAISSAQIDLNWLASSGATNYKLYRSLTIGGPYTLLASNLVTTSYSDLSLSGGTTNYYVVTAVSVAGESTNSVPASAVTLPSAPANLTATGGINQISASWSSSFGAASYDVYRATASGGPYAPLAAGLTVTNLIDSAVITGQTYYYAVTAQNISGASGYSTEAAATPTPSLAPVAVTWQFVGKQLHLNWPEDHTGWRLETKTNLLQTSWDNVSGGAGTNSLAFPALNGSGFFRLVYP